MIDERIKNYRKMFMAVSIIDHHSIISPKLSAFDICERLGEVWDEMGKEIPSKAFTLDVGGIMWVNEKIASALGEEPGGFNDQETWAEFVEDCGDIEDDPSHVLSWIFSELYWNRLTKFRLSTVWLFINAINVQHGYPLNQLAVHKLGEFLDALSGSGPPIYDGQTFYPDEYAG